MRPDRGPKPRPDPRNRTWAGTEVRPSGTRADAGDPAIEDEVKLAAVLQALRTAASVEELRRVWTDKA